MVEIKNILLAWELHNKKVPVVNIAKLCGKHRVTVTNWIKNIEEKGLSQYLEYLSSVRKKERKQRQVSLDTKKKIWDIMSHNSNISGYNIKNLLTEKHGITLSVSKVYAIMKERIIV